MLEILGHLLYYQCLPIAPDRVLFLNQKIFWYFSNFFAKNKLWVLIRSAMPRQFYWVPTSDVFMQIISKNTYLILLSRAKTITRSGGFVFFNQSVLTFFLMLHKNYMLWVCGALLMITHNICSQEKWEKYFLDSPCYLAMIFFFISPEKLYGVGTHLKRLSKLLISTHNICFHGEIRKSF